MARLASKRAILLRKYHAFRAFDAVHRTTHWPLDSDFVGSSHGLG
jgi:hypothetical protein